MVELLRGDINGERYAILKRHRSRPEGLKARFKIVNEGLCKEYLRVNFKLNDT